MDKYNKKNMKNCLFIMILFLVIFGIFSSCTGNNTGSEINEKDIERETRAEFAIIALKADYLRSPEEKMLMSNLESLFYENVEYKDNKIVRIPDKEEFRKMRVPEKYYYMLKKDVEDINNYTDTTTISRLISLEEAFQESKQEYLERKKERN